MSTAVAFCGQNWTFISSVNLNVLSLAQSFVGLLNHGGHWRFDLVLRFLCFCSILPRLTSFDLTFVLSQVEIVRAYKACLRRLRQQLTTGLFRLNISPVGLLTWRFDFRVTKNDALYAWVVVNWSILWIALALFEVLQFIHMAVFMNEIVKMFLLKPFYMHVDCQHNKLRFDSARDTLFCCMAAR